MSKNHSTSSAIKWQGNIQAQRESDAAYAKLRDKPKPVKKTKRKQRHNPNKGVFVGTYSDYISKSKQWRKKRAKAIKHYGGKCEICGSKQRIHVHHLHYRTLFRESMSDLQLLCEDCHANEHEGKNNMVADSITKKYIDMFRQ